MTSAERNNDLISQQEKLEWVTPKISLMSADSTMSKGTKAKAEATVSFPYIGTLVTGPS
ncbi:hypothetical protein [Synechococcus sp. SYN20]|uniref:hypothetical protein n=1 Tax=Synechococcus sp. SYN20 TaxID=1050714 RepID=UPI00164503C1|nr:hypothetical protein [Synechococcus sp. SYN20]